MPEGWHRVIQARGIEAKQALLSDPHWRDTAHFEWSFSDPANLLAENAFGTTSALLHFNLACYHCQLGEEALAMERLARAFRLDAAMKTCAMQDEDLRPLWPLISACS